MFHFYNLLIVTIFLALNPLLYPFYRIVIYQMLVILLCRFRFCSLTDNFYFLIYNFVLLNFLPFNLNFNFLFLYLFLINSLIIRLNCFINLKIYILIFLFLLKVEEVLFINFQHFQFKIKFIFILSFYF